MAKPPLFLVLLLLLITAVAARDWPQMGYDGVLSSGVDRTVNSMITASSGSQVVPLSISPINEPAVCDLDADGKMEYIFTTTTDILIYHIDGYAWSFVDSFTLENPAVGTVSCGDYIETNNNVAIQLTTVKGYTFDLIDGNFYLIKAGTLAQTPTSGCGFASPRTQGAESGSSRGYICRAIGTDAVIDYYPSFGTGTNSYNHSVTGIGLVSVKWKDQWVQPPAIVSTANGTVLRMLVGSDPGAYLVNDTSGYIADSITTSRIASGADQHMVGVVVTNANSVDEGYWWTLANETSGGCGFIKGYKPWNTQIASTRPCTTGSQTEISRPVIAHNYLGGDQTVCAGWTNTSQAIVRCYNPVTGAQLMSATAEMGSSITNAWRHHIISAARLQDSLYDDIIYRGYIFRSNGTALTAFNTTVGATAASQNINGYIPVDTANDYSMGILEIGSTTTKAYIYTTPQGLVNPLRWNTAYANGGLFGYYTTSCVDTNITFRGRECVPGGDTDCSYFHDTVDVRERLTAECPGGDVSGAWSYTSPTVSCGNLDAGDYTTRVFLQTESAPTDEGVTRTLTYSVATTNCGGVNQYINNPSENGNSTAGGDDDEPTAGTGGSTQEDISFFRNTITGGDSWVSLLLGVCIVIAIMFGALKYTQNSMVLGLVFLLSVILVTALGLLPAYILILMIVGAVLVIVMSKSMNSGAV